MPKRRKIQCTVDTPQCTQLIINHQNVMCDGCASYLAEFQFVAQGPSPYGPCKTPHTYRMFVTVGTELCTQCGFRKGKGRK